MIINRYIYFEIFHRLVWIFGLLILIFATNKFVDYLTDAASGKIPTDYVLKLLWYYIISMQPEILPLILFLSVTLAFSRLKQDNELVIFNASGVGRNRQTLITMRFTVIFCVIVAVLTFSVSPWSKEKIKILKKQAWEEANISAIKAGQFKLLNKGKSIVYVEEIDDEKFNMQNVFLQLQRKDEKNIIKSESAAYKIDEQNGNRYLIFRNGIRYIVPVNELDYQITEYENYAVLIETSDEESYIPRPSSLPTLILLRSSDPEYIAELQWRISSVIACILLSILAISLNHLNVTIRSYGLFLLGILIYIIYTNLLGISRALLEKDKISSLLGMWWVHLLLGLIILSINYIQSRARPKNREDEIQFLPADQ